MNTKKHIIIAIDGPSGTGKSTTAKIVAKDLGLTYLDTGAMYRAITFAALEKNIAPTDKAGIDQLLQSTKIRFDDNNQIVINGVNREKEIRGKQVSEAVSPYSAIPEVRSVLTQWQREIASERSCILDGRDIGTVVFPKAELKLFLTASPEVRAQRRYDELVAKGETPDYAAVLKDVNERDYRDTHRAESPLKQADDAIVVDNSHMSREEQMQVIYGLFDKAVNS